MSRLLDHGPGPPHWNMAVDMTLLRSHAEAGGPATLRFYQWSRPTLSLGAGQPRPPWLSEARLQSLGLALVRRPTGGRAVLHGGDLTYCLVAGLRDGFPSSITAVYQRLSRALQVGLAELGVAASPGASLCPQGRSFNCFARVSRGDLTWQGRKLVGSAQVWQGHSFLQHGAILLSPREDLWPLLQDPARPAAVFPVATLAEILAAPVSLADLKAALVHGCQQELGLALTPGKLSPWEEHLLAGGFRKLPRPAGAS